MQTRHNLALLTNTVAQVEFLLHSLEQATGDIGLCVNADKTEFMSFKEGTLSTLSDKPLKLVDLFPYLSSNISSTESDVSIHIVKMWTAIDRLSIILKSDCSNKIKWEFFQAVAVSVLLY